jgi:adenylylsulfate kinase
MSSDHSKPQQKNSDNVVWHNASVTRHDRETRQGHKGAVIWFTGLSGSGKSTLAHEVEKALHERGCHTFVLDGDNVRHGLCGDLGFSANDRQENIRRIGEVSKLFMEAGIIVLTAFISPFRDDRDQVRNMLAENEFIEIYCNAQLAVCESRDVKGLYKKARKGEVANFTGISSPYQEPVNPEIVVNTGTSSVDECVAQIIADISARGICGQEFRQKEPLGKNQQEQNKKSS